MVYLIAFLFGFAVFIESPIVSAILVFFGILMTFKWVFELVKALSNNQKHILIIVSEINRRDEK